MILTCIVVTQDWAVQGRELLWAVADTSIQARTSVEMSVVTKYLLLPPPPSLGIIHVLLAINESFINCISIFFLFLRV